MASAMVFIFLLDNMSGFKNAYNKTFNNVLISHANEHITPNIHECNPIIISSIQETLNNKYNIGIISKTKENLKPHTNKPTDGFKEFSPEIVNNHGVVFEDSALQSSENLNSYEKKDNNLEDSYETETDHKIKDKNVYRQIHDVNKPDVNKTNLADSAPYLVAIFETLSNVTAQTCGGVLMSPQWVLTTASCINLLNNLYKNTTTQTEVHHYYTVVVGSTNPLVDGTVHNVTEILLHPDLEKVNKTVVKGKNETQNTTSIALMKITPPTADVKTPQITNKIDKQKLRIFGWVLKKNESGFDSLHATSFTASATNASNCKLSSVETDAAVCLSTSNETDKDISQKMSFGGPVLVRQDDIVYVSGVVQIDEQFVIMYPLHIHQAWINSTLNKRG